MVATNHYRWDFIGLSTDIKPTPATSVKVVDGSTYYTSDDSKLYVWYKDQWYEKTVEGGGGGDITVVQTIGTSTTDVMSQDATTSMVFDGGDDTKIKIGYGASNIGTNGIAIGTGSFNNSYSSNNISIGNSAHANQADTYDCIAMGQLATSRKHNAIALGRSADATGQGAIALGAYSSATRNGEINVGTSWGATGFNSTNYRLISGVHDGQDAHDAVTVGQVNSVIDAINTALSTNIPHIGA